MSSQQPVLYLVKQDKLHNTYTQVYNTKHSNPTCPKKVCTWTAQNQFTQVIMEVGHMNFVLIVLLAGFMRLNTSSRCSGIERVIPSGQYAKNSYILLQTCQYSHFLGISGIGSLYFCRYTLQVGKIRGSYYMLGRQTLRIIQACGLNLRNTQVAFTVLLSFYSHNVISCICNKHHTQLY